MRHDVASSLEQCRQVSTRTVKRLIKEIAVSTSVDTVEIGVNMTMHVISIAVLSLILLLLLLELRSKSGSALHSLVLDSNPGSGAHIHVHEGDVLQQRPVVEKILVNISQETGWTYDNGTYKPKSGDWPPASFERDRDHLNKLLFSGKNQSYSREDLELLLDAAERGTGYDPYEGKSLANLQDSNKTWNVVLWSPWEAIIRVSGFPSQNGLGSCPYHPKCRIYQSKSLTALKEHANVVVIPSLHQNDPHDWIFGSDFRSDGSRKPYRVMYQREPSWWATRSEQEKFDFQMGLRWQSAILNPIFFREPSFLLTNGLKNHRAFQERNFFALSMISDCGAPSLRDEYLKKLRSYLGTRRVHQYGSCGDGHFMPYDKDVVLRKVSKYKFYFAFENYIEPGYVSEKLGKTLSYGPIPVYYGAPDVPSITKTPSFINVMDFPTPKELAKHLLWLSENQTEYDKYHEWRHDPHSLHPEFLKLLALQRPGAVETGVHAKVQGSITRANRRAACCRLCNESWLRKLALTPHLHEAFDPPRWKTWINHNLFNNTLNDDSFSNALLKDDALEPDGRGEEPG